MSTPQQRAAQAILERAKAAGRVREHHQQPPTGYQRDPRPRGPRVFHYVRKGERHRI